MQTSSSSQPRSARVILIAVAVVLAFVGSYYARHALNPDSGNTSTRDNTRKDYQRIIGLSPSLVEIIYQLDLKDRLVGVSRFCKYPPEASKKPVVGGYVDLDYEAVLTLKPDCVLLLEEQRVLAEKLENIGIHTIVLDHASTQGVIDSIRIIGNALGRKSEAAEVVTSMHARIQKLNGQAQPDPKPRILVCIERDTNSGFPDRVIAAGNRGVHQEYITMAGGENAYQGPVAYPLLSREKLIHLNPDIIIELIPDKVWKEKGRETLLRQWAQFSELKAVKNKRIIFLHEHKHTIPGPRFIDTLEIFSQAVHSTPEDTSP